MFRAWVIATLAVLSTAAQLTAQTPLFKWEAGKDISYRVTQITTTSEAKADKTQESTTRLDLIKKWKVASVDAAGIATLTMSLERLRMETKVSGGETVLFDSAEPAKSNPALREEMTKYVKSPVLSILVNNRGQIMEIRECKFGPPSRLEADLPLKLILPGTAITAGQEWERKFAIHIEPVQGQTPEQTTYEASQMMTCKSVDASKAVFTITTKVNNPPESPVDQIPLLPLQPNGEIVFDITAGRLQTVKYQFAKELKGTAGEESKYNFTTSYTEELMK